jgi:hypothetical protein
MAMKMRERRRSRGLIAKPTYPFSNIEWQVRDAAPDTGMPREHYVVRMVVVT